jgi:hypothetical protein
VTIRYAPPMRKSAVLLFLLACKGEPAKRGFGIAAEITGTASLVRGTSRFGIVTDTWYDGLVENPAAGKAIAALQAEHGAIEIFLGKTPIVIGGDEHHEQKLRITPAPIAIDTHVIPTKVELLPDGREVWAYTEELVSNILIDGVPAPPLARLGTLSEALSPVRKKLCEHPTLLDIAGAYALFVECDDTTPRRLVQIGGTEVKLPSRAELALDHELLAVTRVDVRLVGVQDGKLAIVRGARPTLYGPATRVLGVVVADDDAVWTLALTGDGIPGIARDGVAMPLAEAPTAIARDAKLGVVVLAGKSLYAEHPPATPAIIR